MGNLKVGLGIPHSGWNFQEARACIFSSMVAAWVYRSGVSRVFESLAEDVGRFIVTSYALLVLGLYVIEFSCQGLRFCGARLRVTPCPEPAGGLVRKRGLGSRA